MKHALLHHPPGSRAGAQRDSVELDGDLRIVLDNLPVILWFATADGRITMSEGRGLTSLGLHPGELVGSSIFEVVRDFPEVRELVTRAFAGETVTGTVRMQERWHEYHITPRRGPDGQLAGVIGVSSDVTTRKEVEEDRDRLYRAARRALLGERAARRRATFLAQASRVLAGSLDQDTTLLSIAHLVVPEIADGCVVDVLDPTHPRRPVVAYRDPAREAELVEIAERVRNSSNPVRASLLAGGDPVFHPRIDSPEVLAILEPALRHDLLEVIHAVSMASLPMKARGRFLGILNLFTVAESGRQFDQDDVELAADLAVHAALAIDNARLYGEQTLAVQRRDEFLSVASHELRTPVTSLQLAVQALSRQQERSEGGPVLSPALRANMLRTAERQSKRLAQLVENLLDVSRIATGQLSMQLDQVDLAELARETTNGMAVDVAQADCTIELTADTPVVGLWDRVRLEQVVTNLLSNAIKYGRGKPVLVSVTTDGTLACLRVEDHGIGIPYDRQASIFDRFERAVSARHYGGFGLGLYIVKQIVTVLGGTIVVDSTPGVGATFTVTLPLRPTTKLEERS